jgi:hypothetical protein
VYVDVNLLGYADPIGRLEDLRELRLKFGEVATFKATYPEPFAFRLVSGYVGGGFMLSRSVGIA